MMAAKALDTSAEMRKLCGSKMDTRMSGDIFNVPLKARRMPKSSKPWVLTEKSVAPRVIKHSEIAKKAGLKSSMEFRSLFREPSAAVKQVERSIKHIKKFNVVCKTPLPDDSYVEKDIPEVRSIKSILDDRKVAMKSALILASIVKKRTELDKMESKLKTQFLRERGRVKKNYFEPFETPAQLECVENNRDIVNVDGECVSWDLKGVSLSDFIVVKDKKKKRYEKRFTKIPTDPVNNAAQMEQDKDGNLDFIRSVIDNHLNSAQMEFNIGNDTRDLLRSLIDTATNKSVNVTHHVDLGFPDVNAFFGSVKDFLFKHPVTSTIFVVTTALYIQPFQYGLCTFYKCIVTITAALSMYYLSPEVRYWVEWLVERVNLYINDWSQMEGGSGLDLSGWYETIATFATGALLALVTGKSVCKSDASGFMRCISMASSFKVAMTDGIRFVTELFSSVINWFTGKLELGEDWKIKFPSSRDKFPEYYRLYDSVTEFIKEMREKPDLTVSKGQRARALMTDMEIFIRDMDKSKEFATYRSDIVMLKQNLAGIVKLFDGAGISAGLRYKPIWLHLMGWTAVGKSSILRRIASDVFAHIATKEEWEEYEKNSNSLIYPYAFENNFYDNYMGQWATVIDELGLVVEVAGSNDDGWMSMIRMINIFCMPLDMAELERKGKTNFTSRMILSTSNRRHLSELKNIYFPEAIRSRCNFPIMCYTKKEYARTLPDGSLPEDREKWQVDFRKVPKNRARMVIPCEFGIKDLKTGLLVGDLFDYDELIFKCVFEYKSVAEYSELMINSAVDDIRYLSTVRDQLLAGHYLRESDANPAPPVRTNNSSPMAEIVFEEDSSSVDGLIIDDPMEQPKLRRFPSSDPASDEDKLDYFVKKADAVKRDLDRVKHLTDGGFIVPKEHLTSGGFIIPKDEVVNQGQMMSWITDVFHRQVTSQVETVVSDKLRRAANGIDPRLPKQVMQGSELACIAYAREYNVDSWMDFAMKREPAIVCTSQSILDATTEFESMYMTEFLDSMTSDSETFIDRFLDNKWIKSITKIVAFSLPIASFATVLSYMFSRKTPVPEAVSDKPAAIELMSVIPETLTFPAQSGAVKNKGFRRKFSKPASAQYELSESSENLMLRILAKNCLALYITDSVYTRRAHITMVKGTIGVTPKHYWTGTPDDAKVTLFHLDNPNPILIGPSKATSVSAGEFIKLFYNRDEGVGSDYGEDLMAFNLTFLKPFRDITKHFVREGSDCLNGAYVEGYAVSWRIHDNLRVYAINKNKLEFFRDSVTINGDEKYTNKLVVKCDRTSFNGACGVPYFNNNGQIIGIHIGGGERGVAIVVLKQHILDICEALSPTAPIVETVEPDVPKLVIGDSGQMEIGRQHEVVGIVPYVHSKPENNILRSEYYGKVFPAKKAPANVRVAVTEEGIYDPLSVSRLKTNDHVVRIPPLLHKVVSDHVIVSTLKNLETPPMGRRLATNEEAIGGIDGEVPGMTVNTSPGYPLSTLHIPGGKAHWIGGEDGYDLTTEQAQELLKLSDVTFEKLCNGERPLLAFKDSVKVELRALEKVDKPRQVNAYSMLGTILVRRFCLSFIVSFMYARISVGSALGMNVYSQEWDDMANILLLFNKLIAGDYGGFDRNFPKENHQSLIKLINMYYAGEDPRITLGRTTLLMDMFESFHVVTVCSSSPPTQMELVKEDVVSTLIQEERISFKAEELVVDGPSVQSHVINGVQVYFYTVLYKWHGGMPSGHPLTTIGNIHGNSINLRCAAVQAELDISTDIQLSDLGRVKDILTSLLTIAFGDDHIVGIQEMLAERVTFRSIRDKLEGFGMVYTTPEKDGTEYDHRILAAISFLSRHFVYNPILRRYVAALELDSIDNMLLWKKKKEAPHIMADRVKQMFREYSFHGKELYEQRVALLLPHLKPEHLPDSLQYEVQLMEASALVSEYF